MAQTVRIKRTSTSGNTWENAPSFLAGEFALNTTDRKAWLGTVDNTSAIEILTDAHGAPSVQGKVKAISGALTKGQPVTITGYDNVNELIEVQAANQATTFANAIMMEDVALDGTGYAIMTGALEGLDTSSWVEGDILYVGNGALTNVEPTSGYSQPVAFVLRENATLGALQIQINYPKQDAADVRFTPAGNLIATSVQAALEELDTEKANLSGATFTGDISSPNISTTSTLISSATGSTSSTTATTIDSFAGATYNSGKFIIQVKDNVTGEFQVSELLVVHNGTTASSTEYGVVYSDTLLAGFGVNYNAGTIEIQATALSANSTSYTVSKNLIEG